jgi:CubicO group peptidase (beta-lactamase class C family)
LRAFKIGTLFVVCVLGTLTAASDPASAGNDLPDLNGLAQEAQQLPRLHSLLISQDGELVFERYFNGRSGTQPANMKSASKSVISALIGIAIDQGIITGVDQTIGDFFPEYAGTDLESTLNTITVGHLLSMQAGLASTSGRNYGSWVNRPDWVDGALRMPMVAEPGTDMIYSTGSTHLLSAILERASGMSGKAFAQTYLADPLGFRMPFWSRDPKGIYFGGNDMEMTPRQMLAFGQLYLNGGRHADRQVIPADWVADSLLARVASPRGEGRHYGYGWWLRDMAGLQVPLAWGYGGQLIFVLPEFEMVIVATSDSTPDNSRRNHLRELYELVETRIIAPKLR